MMPLGAICKITNLAEKAGSGFWSAELSQVLCGVVVQFWAVTHNPRIENIGRPK